MSRTSIFSGDNDWMFWPPSNPHPLSAWLGHIPFAHWLVGAVRPNVVVELGTHVGASYAGFCESVKRNTLPTRVWAVDTWRGDTQAGHYSDEVFKDLSKFNADNYGNFSALLRTTFDEALGDFGDRTIDILHIDGLHTYEAVKHDFDSWRPKLAHNAVVLFHDTAERQADFGVWKLWSEVQGMGSSFEFMHSHGLGVLQLGEHAPPGLANLFQRDHAEAIRARFAWLGERLERDAQLWHARRNIRRLEERLHAAAAEHLRLKTELARGR